MEIICAPLTCGLRAHAAARSVSSANCPSGDMATPSPRCRSARIPRYALLIMDMINTFDFQGGVPLARSAIGAARNIHKLRRAFASAELPVVFCNDNFGQWRSDFRAVYQRCAKSGSRGAEIAELLAPAPDDYFILKPKHSAFYLTPLDLLVRSLNVSTLVITGIAGDSCVLATLSDAHIRDFEAIVVSDAIASQRPTSNRRVLAHVKEAKWAKVNSTRSVASALVSRNAHVGGA